MFGKCKAEQSRRGVQSAGLGLGDQGACSAAVSVVAVLLRHKAFKAGFDFVPGRVCFAWAEDGVVAHRPGTGI